MSARTNFLQGLVSLLLRAHKVSVFLNWIQGCNSSREVGLNDSFTPMAHVHNVGGVNPPVCSCMHAGWFIFTQTHTPCQPRSVGSFPHEVSFRRWRELMPQREMRTRHTPAGGKWRLMKSPGFLGSFLGRAGNLNALPHLGSGSDVAKWWTRGTHHHGTSSKHEYLTFVFISALAGADFIHSKLCLFFNHREGCSQQQRRGHDKQQGRALETNS